MKKNLLFGFFLLIFSAGAFAQCENRNPDFEDGVNATGNPNWYYSFGNPYGVSPNTSDGSPNSGHAPMGGAIAINNFLPGFVATPGVQYEFCADMSVSTTGFVWAQIKMEFIDAGGSILMGDCSTGVPGDDAWSNYCTTCIAPAGTDRINVFAQSNGAEFWVDNFCVSEFVAAPITLESISASEKGEANVIDWITNSEENVDYFEIQKSTDGATDWTTVSRTPAAGFSYTQKRYQVEDSSPSKVSFYRLINHDFDGRKGYSPVVNVERKETLDQLSLFPNPASDDLSVSLSLKKESTYTIHDLTGRVIDAGRLSSGESTQQIDIQKLLPGIYLFKVNNNVTRFVKS